MTIYQEGDRVYDYEYGWGIISEINLGHRFPIIFKYGLGEGKESFGIDGKYAYGDRFPRLSFTEYDLINGGFSQKRPPDMIAENSIVYVSNNKDGPWSMRYFKCFDPDEVIRVYSHQKKSSQTTKSARWPFYSIKNPLENA